MSDDHDATSGATVKVVMAESKFLRFATVINMVLTTILAFAALVLGWLYHRSEESRSQARDEFDVRVSCLETTMRLRETMASARSREEKLHVLHDVSSLSDRCATARQPIPAAALREELDRLSKDPDPTVAEGARRTESTLARNQVAATAPGSRIVAPRAATTGMPRPKRHPCQRQARPSAPDRSLLSSRRSTGSSRRIRDLG